MPTVDASVQAEADALFEEGMNLHRNEDLQSALDKFSLALLLYRRAGNRIREGRTLYRIGILYNELKIYPLALDFLEQALAIQNELDSNCNGPLATLNSIDQVDTLNMIGSVYGELGRQPEAFESLWRALSIARKVKDREQEGRILNNIGLAYWRQGQYIRALACYQQALTIKREVKDFEGEAVTLLNIGAVYGSQGRYDRSLDFCQQALSIRSELEDPAGMGVIFNNIGEIYWSLADWSEALEHYQKSLTITRELGDQRLEATTLNNIGVVYGDLGQYSKALEYLQKALTIARNESDQSLEGTTINNMGEIYHNQGQFAEALEYHQQALMVYRKVDDREGEAVAINNIASVYGDTGQYGRALDFYQQVLAIARDLGDVDLEGTILGNLGGIYCDLGQFDQAMDLFRQSLDLKRDVGDRDGEATALNGIGSILVTQGKYEPALTFYQQALEIVHAIGNRSNEGTTLSNIGDVYEHLNQYDRAWDFTQQALAIKRELGDRDGEAASLSQIGEIWHDLRVPDQASDNVQRALTIYHEIGNLVGETEILIGSGVVYEAQGYDAQALMAYQEATEMLERIRGIAGSEANRVSFIAQYAHLYIRVVTLFHQQGQYDEAFYTSERGRARAFLDSLAISHIELNDNEAVALVAQEQETYAIRQATQDTLARARTASPPDSQFIADLETQLKEAEAAHAHTLQAIEARHDQLAALVPGRSSVSRLADVQILLDDQTTLVSYFLLEDKALVFVIGHNDFNTVELNVNPEDLLAKVEWFRLFPNLHDASPESAQTLYRWLIEPLKPYLPAPNANAPPRLIIVPHQVLHYLPFAALSDGQCYLGDDYFITYLPSASVLKFIQQNVEKVQTVSPEDRLSLLLGNPATGESGLCPLAFAEQEVQTISNLFNTYPLVGQAATESRLKEQAATASILHLAAHGSYNRYNPLYSAIALAPDEVNDGRLEVHEVYGLNLKGTDLVVLSACESQLGELSAGDELVGLTRAFFFAGTPSVIASLWSVDDRSTGLLMERFYTYLRQGIGKAAALRQAQTDVRAEYPSPYYWAGFVLSGDG